MTKNIKLMITFAIIMLIACVLSGCNNSEITSSVEAESIITEQVTETAPRATVSLSAEMITSRSALPEVTPESIDKFILCINDSNIGIDPNNAGIIGLWNSYESMRDTTMDVETGTWTFTLSAISKKITYIASKTVNLVAGSNSLHFELAESMRELDRGYGDLSVELRYDPDEEIGLITCGLYNTQEQVILGSGNTLLAQQAGGRALYTQTRVPSGDYFVIFNIYADTEKKLLRSSFREYACIFSGKTSESICEIPSLAKVYTISYNLGKNGKWVSGYTPNTKFTRLGADIELPPEDKVTRDGFEFDGWYDNAQYKGNALTVIPAGSWGNKTIYAKWRKKCNITFDANGGKFGNNDETASQTVVVDVTTDLMSSADLRLRSKGNKKFYGWSTSRNASNAEYIDGGEIKINASIILYAIWSASNVSAVDSGDKTDSDGDGLTDYEELYTFHTDPTNKDTDGDGWTDYEEIHGLYNADQNIFNPRIADVPKIDIVISGQPVISKKYTTSTSNSESQSETLSEGDVASRSHNESNGKTESDNHSHSFSVGYTHEHSIGIGLTTSGYSHKFQVKGDTSNSWSYGHSDSYSYSSNESKSHSKSISNGKTTSLSNSQTWTGGSFKILVKFRNPSNIAYTVDKLSVAVTRTPNNRADHDLPVGEIDLSNIGTIQPGGETGEFTLEKDLSLGATEDLLKWSNAINVRIAGYAISIKKNIDNNASHDFTGALTRVMNQCVGVNIDYGPNSLLRTESYFVSTKYKYNKDAMSASDLYTNPTLLEVLEDVLGLTRSSGKLVLKSDGRIQSIRGVANLDDPNLADGKVIQGCWFLTHKYVDENMQPMEAVYQMAYNVANQEDIQGGLEGITVGPKDEINIFFSVDRDGDGVPKRLEIAHGTSDDNADTDGDGLTDFEEIFGWYNNNGKHPKINSYKYNVNHKCCTNPINDDTDGDDVPDNEDDDPIVTKVSNIAQIRTAKYASNVNDTFTALNFPDLSTGTTTNLSGQYEKIYLDIEPKLLFSQLHYRLKSNGKWMNNEWEKFDKTTQMPMKIGKNSIYIRVTAPDEITTKEYVINVDSELPAMTGFNLYAPKLSGGNVTVEWDDYTDSRMADKYRSYILAIQKGKNSVESPRRSEVNLADAYSKGAKYLDDTCFLTMKADDMTRGSAALVLEPCEDYAIGLFACINTNDSNTYTPIKLAEKTVKTSKAKNGTLTFYACNVYDEEDHDGGGDSEYRWDVSSNMFDKDTTTLSQQRQSMDDGSPSRRAYCFECMKIHGDTKHDHAKALTCNQIKRDDKYSGGYFKIHFYEEDGGADNDDDLGEVIINFSYDKEKDEVNFKWEDWRDKDNRGDKTVNLGKVGFKQKKDYVIKNYSDDYGCVEFRFSVSWE